MKTARSARTRQPPLDPVVQPQGGRTDAARNGLDEAGDMPAQRGREPHHAVRAVAARPDEEMPQPRVQRYGGARGAVTAVVGPGPAQELGAGGARQPVRAGQHRHQLVDHPAEQHRAPGGEFGALVDEREDPVVLLEDVEVPR